MKKKLHFILFGALIIMLSCTNEEAPVIDEGSYLPMQIGNYWKFDEGNYTEITDTVRIDGNLYYKFFSLIGWDGEATDYLRIDENQNLIAASPDYPDLQVLLAKFNASPGETFWTRNDQTFNDKEVTVLQKENALISFKFQTVYSQNPFPPDTTIYKKGFGWTKKTYMWFDKWTEVRIDGKLVPVD